MVDDTGVIVPGTRALQFPTEAGARKAYQEAAERGQVKAISGEREYIVLDS